MYGSKAAGVRMSDPRPVSDRAFMNQSIRALIKYLSEHNYNSAISPKILTRPTNKQFQEIVAFLIKQVDPCFMIGQKFENDVTLFLKGVGCVRRRHEAAARQDHARLATGTRSASPSPPSSPSDRKSVV